MDEETELCDICGKTIDVCCKRGGEPEVRWQRDPAASGWRSRCWLEGLWEALAYDDGSWELRGPPHGFTLASGKEGNAPLNLALATEAPIVPPEGEAAKKRALRVYGAMKS